MSIAWDGYEEFDPGVSGTPNALPRSVARQVFDRCIETKDARIEMLRCLLKAKGVELGSEDAAVQDLNDWFQANVVADPDQPGRLRSAWYSVADDIALFLGDVMIERHPNLRWEFFTWGKSNVAFQRHVIMGFSTEDPKFPPTSTSTHGRDLRPPDHRKPGVDPHPRDSQRSRCRGRHRRRGCAASWTRDRDRRVLAVAADGCAACLSETTASDDRRGPLKPSLGAGSTDEP